jgi:molybdopterin converting factor subunit 1
MQIEVLLFAATRDRVGRSRTRLELREGATVETAIAALVELYPKLRDGLSSLRYAVNEEFVERSAPLAGGDTLALIPPVSGG